jgi:N-acetylglucosamine malate deacetylase 1|tara:strand:- start:3252 stop:3941 length:690 start_codon:yes stop_codon:yes gene_type:complete
MNVLVIGAHPDDESIGAGATIAKHIEKGDSVFVVLFSVGHKPIQPKLKTQAYDMLKVFGINKKNIFWLNCKSGNFMSEDQLKVNGELTDIISKIKPKIVYTHYYGDTHQDHIFVFHSTMVACRPIHFPRGVNEKDIWTGVEKILCYEIHSSSNWSGRLDKPFDPTEYNIISKKNLQSKLDAYACYKKEVRPGDHPRSLDSLKTLAKFRGNSVGRPYAEAFVVIRYISDD